MFMTVLLFQIFGLAMPFLLQNDGQTPAAPLPDRSYQDIITLLVEEKNERKQFETKITNRLDQIDGLHRQVSIQLDKDRNSREYTSEKLAGIAQQLRNMSATDSHFNKELYNQSGKIADIAKQLKNLSTAESHIGSDLAHYRLELTSQSGDISDLAEQLRNLSSAEGRMESEIVHYCKELANQSREIADLSEQLRNISAAKSRMEGEIVHYHKELANQSDIITHIVQHLDNQSKVTTDISQQLTDISDLGRQSENKISNMMAVNGELTKDFASMNKTVHLMTTPIGFSLSNPVKTQQHKDAPLQFHTSLYNSHNMYNSTTGSVTVTVPGMYYMTTTIVREPGISQSYCCMRQNGKHITNQCTVGNSGDTNGYASGSTSVFYHLNAGDTVSLDCAGIDHMHWSSDFNGYLVQTDIP